MKKKYKLLKIITIAIALFIMQDVSAQSEFVRVCRYHDNSNNETVYVKWKSHTYYPGVYDATGKYISVVTTLTTADVFFNEGCGKYLAFSKGLGSIDDMYSFTSKDKANKKQYNFDGVISENKDVYFSEAYKENRDNPDNNKHSNKTIKCSYTLTNGYKVELTSDMYGQLSVTTKTEKDKTRKVTLINGGEVANSFGVNNKCPSTVCYNKQGVGKDDVEFFMDASKKCPWVLAGGFTNSDYERTKTAETKIPALPTKEEQIRGEVLKENAVETSDSYITCLQQLDEGPDGEKKCFDSRANYLRTCGGDNGSSGCIEKKTQYINCVESKYESQEIDEACNPEQTSHTNAQRFLEEYADETGDETVRHFFTANYSTGIGTDIGYGDIDCETLLGSEMLEWLDSMFFMIQVAAVVLTIVLGMLDVTKAVASQEDDALKKAFKNLKIRLMVTAILILLPVIIEFILSFVDVPGLTNKNPLCK